MPSRTHDSEKENDFKEEKGSIILIHHQVRLVKSSRILPDEHSTATIISTRLDACQRQSTISNTPPPRLPADRDHGYRAYRPGRTCLSKAASHLPQLESEEEQNKNWKRRQKVVQGCWTRLQDTKNCDRGLIHWYVKIWTLLMIICRLLRGQRQLADKARSKRREYRC